MFFFLSRAQAHENVVHHLHPVDGSEFYISISLIALIVTVAILRKVLKNEAKTNKLP